MKALIQIFLSGVVGALTVTVLIGAKGPTGADPRRAFYLTSSIHEGGGGKLGPLEACAKGFHMASLWEILDVSNVRYAMDKEGEFDVFRRSDSGVGPPSGFVGWVRTGFATFNSSPLEGTANCDNWSNTAGYGTAVKLGIEWDAPGTGDPSVVIAPWDSSAETCTTTLKVWCAED